MALKKKARKAPEINASSMADIAFLLLIFFLVTTTMDIDKGLLVLLPPHSEEPPDDMRLNKRNVLDILVNYNDQLLVKGEPLDVRELKNLTMRHVDNHGREADYSESPLKAVVSLKNDRGTSYDMYITVQNELKSAYNEMRDRFSKQVFGKIYEELTDVKSQKYVREHYPLRISEAEPEEFGKDE